MAQVLHLKDIGNIFLTIINLSFPLPRFTMRSWSKFLGKYLIRTLRYAIQYYYASLKNIRVYSENWHIKLLSENPVFYMILVLLVNGILIIRTLFIS